MNDENNNEKKDGSTKRSNHGYYYSRVYPGVMLIFVGVLFLLNSFGVLNGDVWGKLWPFFIIIPGVLVLFRPR